MKGMVWVEAAAGVRRSLWLGGAAGRRPRVALTRWLDLVSDDVPAMGGGDLVDAVQRRIADLLGKESALLLPTGKMAQQIAQRIHAEHSGHRTFAAHPACHLANWELDGYAVVHGLRFSPLGEPGRLFTEADLRAVSEPLASVVWELPQRDLGGTLPAWETLDEQVAAARELGARTHLDGARIWEAQTAYERPFAEIAGLFDSVYVSLYKTLESPRGAVLAGSESFIAEARTWSVRLGGDSAGNWPLAAAGLAALDDILPRMAAYRDHAVAMATALNSTGVVSTVPDRPLTPLFHVVLPVSPESAAGVHPRLSGETGLEVFRSLRRSEDPDRCAFEITIGESGMGISPAEVAGFVTELVERASVSAGAPASERNS